MRHPDGAQCAGAVEAALSLSAREKPAPEVIETLGGGWVAEEALAISLFCALNAEGDLMSGVTLAVNHSGDTDSTGAITGNILGCLLGRSAVPPSFTRPLELKDVIERLAVDLFVGYRADEHWRTLYPWG